MLKAANIKPTAVCMMEQQEDDSVRRLKNRRIDPITGKLYNVDIHFKIPPEVEKRLEVLKQDDEATVVKRFECWSNTI